MHTHKAFRKTTWTSSERLMYIQFKSFVQRDQMGQGIQEWTKKYLRKTAFKKSEVIWFANIIFLLLIITSNNGHQKCNRKQ